MQDEAPRKPLHSADNTAEEKPIFPHDWDSRLADARARRHKVLAEKVAAKTAAQNTATPTKPGETRARAPVSSEWEKRLDVARAKRLKILAERKAAGVEAPQPKPQPEPGTTRAFPLAVANARAPRSKPAPAPAAPAPTADAAAPAEVAPEPRKRRAALIPLIAIAGFFGIGLGIAIGWALVNAWSETDAPVIATAPVVEDTPTPVDALEEVAIVSRSAPLDVAAPLPRPRSAIVLSPVDATAELAVPAAFTAETGADAPALSSTGDVQLARLDPGQLAPTSPDASAAQPAPLDIVARRPSLGFEVPAWASPVLPGSVFDGTLSAFSDVPREAPGNASTLTFAALDSSFVPPSAPGPLRTDALLASPTLAPEPTTDASPRIAALAQEGMKNAVAPRLSAPAKTPATLPARPALVPATTVTATAPETRMPEPVEAADIVRPDPFVRLADTDMPARTLQVAALDWTLPEVGAAPPPLAAPANFLQAVGLTPNQAARYGLYLFAPGSLTDKNVADYATRLSDTGLDLRTTRRVNFKISKTQIRYYNDSDRALAQDLAGELGIIARDFTANGGDGGRIEIWMQGDSGAAAPKPTRTTRRATTTTRAKPQPVDTRTRLTNSIIEGLRTNK